MKTWIRKLRGIVGIGAVWGLVGTAVGLGVTAIVSVFGTVEPHPILGIFGWALQSGVQLFALGSGFAAVLTMMDGSKTFDELTPGRAALSGALAGATVHPAVGGLIMLGLGYWSEIARAGLVGQMASGAMFFGAAMSAGLAAGTVSLARRAPDALGAGAMMDESNMLDDPGGSLPHQIGST